jgi:hypothetical protein
MTQTFPGQRYPYCTLEIGEGAVQLIGFIPVSESPSIRAIAFLKHSFRGDPVNLSIYVVDWNCQLKQVNPGPFRVKEGSALHCTIKELVQNAQRKLNYCTRGLRAS